MKKKRVKVRKVSQVVSTILLAKEIKQSRLEGETDGYVRASRALGSAPTIIERQILQDTFAKGWQEGFEQGRQTRVRYRKPKPELKKKKWYQLF